jgi:hypothetical protein
MVATPGYLAVEILHTALRDAIPWKDQDAPWYLALVLGSWRAVPLSDLGVGKDAVAELVGLKALVPDGGAALEAAAGRALSGDGKGASADFGQALSGLIETPLFGHLVARLKQRLPPAPRRRRHVMAKDLQPGEEYEHLLGSEKEFGPASDEWAREQAKQNTEFGPAADEWAREQAEKAAGEEEEEGEGEGEGEKPPATPPQPAPPPPAPPASGAGKVFIALGVGLGVAGLIALIALLARRRRAIVLPPVPPLPPQVAG